MKNIAILGTPRSGKSTLTNMLIEKNNNYQIISGDMLRAAYFNTFPLDGITKREREKTDVGAPKLQIEFLKISMKRKKDYFYILDSCDISVELAAKELKNEELIIIFLVNLNINSDELFENIRKYESDRDWTISRSDEEVLERCKEIIEDSKRIVTECDRYNIKCFDTSKDRELVLNEVLNYIKNSVF